MRPAPPEMEALVQRLYDATLKRDFEAFRALVAPQLEWPDLTRGGWLATPEQVRDYWAYNDASIRVELTPVEVGVTDDGRILVDVNLVIWNRAGQLWSDMCVRHCYTLQDGLFWRMDVVSREETDPGP
jgi:ketosteroid isomerase-like protein